MLYEIYMQHKQKINTFFAISILLSLSPTIYTISISLFLDMLCIFKYKTLL